MLRTAALAASYGVRRAEAELLAASGDRPRGDGHQRTEDVMTTPRIELRDRRRCDLRRCRGRAPRCAPRWPAAWRPRRRRPRRPDRADARCEVSFDADAFVRLRGQRFVALSGAARRRAQRRRSRGTTSCASQRVVDALRGDLDADAPAAARPPATATCPTSTATTASSPRTRAARDELLAALRALAVVDDAIAEPQPAPPPATPTSPPSSATARRARSGIDAAASPRAPGGLGQKAKIVDIEYSWNTAHEDLAKAAAPGALIANGTPATPSTTPTTARRCSAS